MPSLPSRKIILPISTGLFSPFLPTTRSFSWMIRSHWNSDFLRWSSVASKIDTWSKLLIPEKSKRSRTWVELQESGCYSLTANSEERWSPSIPLILAVSIGRIFIAFSSFNSHNKQFLGLASKETGTYLRDLAKRQINHYRRGQVPSHHYQARNVGVHVHADPDTGIRRQESNANTSENTYKRPNIAMLYGGPRLNLIYKCITMPRKATAHLRIYILLARDSLSGRLRTWRTWVVETRSSTSLRTFDRGDVRVVLADVEATTARYTLAHRSNDWTRMKNYWWVRMTKVWKLRIGLQWKWFWALNPDVRVCRYKRGSGISRVIAPDITGLWLMPTKEWLRIADLLCRPTRCGQTQCAYISDYSLSLASNHGHWYHVEFSSFSEVPVG